MSNGARITELAAADPDRPFLVCGTTAFTRHEFDVATNRAARQLASMGATTGSFLSIALPNSVEFMVAAFGAWKLGVVPHPLSYRLPAEELDAILDLVRPSLFLREFELSDAFDGGPLPDAVAPAWKATMSSGSTGRPKAIVDGRLGVVDPEATPPYRIPRNGVGLVPGPLYHSAPFNGTARALLAGTQVVVMAKYDPVECLALIERHRVTWVTFVPTMMKRILDLPAEVRERYDLSSLEVVYHSGGPCAGWLKQAYIDWFGPERVWELYGATERQATTLISGTEWLEHPGSVGRPNFGEIRIVDEDGQALPPGAIGLVQMRAPESERPTYRYLGAVSTPTADGWDSVGDMGSLDADGYLTLADRRTDLILRGGANVYPAEVEAALESHPAIESCAVIGLPDDDLGQRVHAVISLRSEVTRGSLAAHMGERLALYKTPSSYEVVTVPLRDEAGKIRRSALQLERLDGAGLPGTLLV